MHAALRLLFVWAAVWSAADLLARSEAHAAEPSWEETLARARGQEVFWNAWGGDERINTYIAWVGGRVAEDFGVTLRHVKLSDTAEAVARVLG